MQIDAAGLVHLGEEHIVRFAPFHPSNLSFLPSQGGWASHLYALLSVVPRRHFCMVCFELAGGVAYLCYAEQRRQHLSLLKNVWLPWGTLGMLCDMSEAV